MAEGLVKILFVLAVLGGSVACDPTPSAKVFVMGDSNLPLGEVVGYLNFLKDRPYLVTAEAWPGVGTVADEPVYRDRFAIDRVGMAVDALHPDVVVTTIGVNDAQFGSDAAIDGAREFLAAIGSGPQVIWITPPIAGPNAGIVADLVEQLVGLQEAFPNLWVIPFDGVIDAVVGDACPALRGEFVLLPRDACYVDRANSVHLSSDGRLVLTAMIRMYVQATEVGLFRQDPVTIAADLYDRIRAAGAS